MSTIENINTTAESNTKGANVKEEVKLTWRHYS